MDFACSKCEGTMKEAVEQDDELCNEVKTVVEFTCLVGRVSASVGCETAVALGTLVGGLIIWDVTSYYLETVTL